MDKRKVQVVLYYYAEDKTKHFLLLKMNERRNFFWQNVTGAVEAGESFQEAAIREVQEETGLLLENIDKIYLSELTYKFTDRWNYNVHEHVFAFECRSSWPVIIDSSEHSEYHWLTQKEIDRNSVHFESNYEALKWSFKL